jgi:hypothetical protein
MTDIIVFSLLVLTQYYVSRHRIFKGRHITIIKEEARLATRDPATVLPVP